jgi:hypothetical protein
MMLLVWNSKQWHAVLLALGAVRLGGTPTGARAGHYVQIAVSLPSENRADSCNCNSPIAGSGK